MATVSIRELCDSCNQILDRVERGERITVTRDGREVAEPSAVREALPAIILVERFKRLPRLDPAGLRRDLDYFIDPRISLSSP